MDVSVIMINYNTFSLTKDALDSIFRETKGIDYEVILIDNASPDGSGDRLSVLYGNKIVYLQSGGNLGTSKAFNIALKHASGKYVLWLNTDILLKENFIKKLFDYMEIDPNCGICGGNLFNGRGEPTLSYDKELLTGRVAMYNVRTIVVLFRALFKKQISNHFNYTSRPMRVGGIIGADLMVRRDCFDRVGSFNENIFMYGEETDFTYRVTHETNYTVVSVPDAHMTHLEGGGVSQNDSFNERKETIVLTGISTYLKNCLGKEDVFLYVKARYIAAKKRRFFYSLLGYREKKEVFAQKEAFFRRHLTEFDTFYSSLPGQEGTQKKGERI